MARKAKSRPYHHGDLREALIASATEMIEEGGPSSFTLRECARRAGVSHAAPKNHFATAEDLIAEVAARGFEQFVAALAQAADCSADQSPDARLTAMCRAYVDFARSHRGVYGLMFRERSGFAKSEHLRTAARAAWEQLHRSVAAVTGPGRGDTDAKAAHVWSLVHGIASLTIDRRFPEIIDPDAVIATSVASLPAAIRSVGPAR
jgi:AcrR family transcriptional regulator